MVRRALGRGAFSDPIAEEHHAPARLHACLLACVIGSTAFLSQRGGYLQHCRLSCQGLHLAHISANTGSMATAEPAGGSHTGFRFGVPLVAAAFFCTCGAGSPRTGNRAISFGALACLRSGRLDLGRHQPLQKGPGPRHRRGAPRGKPCLRYGMCGLLGGLARQAAIVAVVTNMGLSRRCLVA